MDRVYCFICSLDTFSIWYGNSWLLLVLLLFSIFTSPNLFRGHFGKIEERCFRKVMEWVDAIIFALIAVYFINTFFFQNYQILLLRLKTLLVGDFCRQQSRYGPVRP